MAASQCLYPIKDTSSAWTRVWLAAHDSDVEGVGDANVVWKTP